VAARRSRKTSPETAAAQPPLPPGAEAALKTLAHEVGRVRECAELLGFALKDAPRADDFQPLADHLYEFAQTTPKLLKSLQGVPEAVGPLEDAVRALEHVLVTLPRAEDYEPLVEPLREFARVAPALAEQLAVVMKSVAPLGDAVAQLRQTTEALQRAPARHAGDGDGEMPRLLAAAARMAEARAAIREALDSLPRDPEYRRVADHLKAMASVSPSLGAWLAEVPKLSMPLGDSIASLERAAELLADGERELRRRDVPATAPAPRGAKAAKRAHSR
jgi:tetratricopeptide (TPR) repeat protein